MIRRVAVVLLFVFWLFRIGSRPALAEFTSKPGLDAKSTSKLDTWSRSELALATQPSAGRDYVPQSTVDFFRALEHNRPHVVTQAGGSDHYAGTMSLREASTFKGFTYEHSLVRRWNSKPGGPRYRLADRGHGYIDIERYDPITGKTLQTLQAYSGSNPRAAIRKFLLSDRLAHKFVVPKNVHAQIKTAVLECEAIIQKQQAGELDRVAANRLVRERARKVGLKFDETTRELYAQDKRHGRGSLGRLGTPQLSQQLQRLVRDRLTSDRIMLNQVQAMVLADPELRSLWERLGATNDATRAIHRMHQDHVRELARGGVGPGEAASLAENWRRTAVPKLLAESNHSLQRASLMGVLPAEIETVLNEVSDAVKKGADPREALAHANEALDRMANQSRRIQVLKAQGVLLVFTIMGAGVDLAMSDQEIAEWIRSDRPVEWGMRAGVGLIAVPLSGAAERAIRENTLRNTGKEATERLGTRLASRIVGGGVAMAIFVTGESVIAAVHGASWGEVADRAYEAALVIAVCEGTVIVTELLIWGEIGAAGGPLGIAVAVGAGLVYEGAKYVWTSRRDLETDRMVFLAKCDVARQKVTQWCDSTCRRIDGRELSSRP